MSQGDNHIEIDSNNKDTQKDNFNESIGEVEEKRMSEYQNSEVVTDDKTSGENQDWIGIRINTEDKLTDGVKDEINSINVSLAQQICEELSEMGKKKKKKKMNKTMKTQLSVLVGLLCLASLVCFLGLTDSGNQLLMKMGIDMGGKIWSTWTKDFDKNPITSVDSDYLDEDDLASTGEEIDPSTIVWPSTPGSGRKQEGVYNILLLGEEAIGSGNSRGRTDVIMVATMNTHTKELKLTSLLRDTLVQIPGYSENKLNSAYEKGGIELLYQTITLNYDLHLDGAVLVNFEYFEKIIDKLGGLELTLGESEARYLNTTNYISNPAYRNVRAGTQILNGNQVLGYARIRKRPTVNGTNNDYGRTERHRMILTAVFNKYKTADKLELAKLMFDILPMVTTDIDSKNFELLLNTFIEMGTLEIQQLRLPANGTFTDNVRVRGMDVLIPEWDKNISMLHEFIFGTTSTNTIGGLGSNSVVGTTGVTGTTGVAGTTGVTGTSVNN